MVTDASEAGVVGVPVRYCSIFISISLSWYLPPGLEGALVLRGVSLEGGMIERLSAERDQPFRAMLRRSPVPLDPVDIVVTRSVLARDDKSSTDL